MKPPIQTRCFKEALARVQHLFVDTPGVALTTADAAQIAGLDRQVCRILLRTLTEKGFLEQRMKGAFVRRPSDSTVTVED
jgi:predicted transcriptional regulator of viral defense system